MEGTSDSGDEEIPRDPADVVTDWTTELVDEKGSEDDEPDVAEEVAEGMTVLSIAGVGDEEIDEGEVVVAELGLLHVWLRSRKQSM